MGNVPTNIARFQRTLPYSSEAFGLYQPLLGWRGQRSVDRFVAGVAAAHADLVSSYTRRIVADVQANADVVQSLHTGKASIARQYSPLIASHIADVIHDKAQGSDLNDPGTWSALLTRDNVDAMLTADVMAALRQDVATFNGPDDQKLRRLEALARRESVLAGTFVQLASQGRADVLRSLFMTPVGAASAVRRAALLAMTDPLDTFDPAHDWNHVGLSPIGIVHLFRQYFFEFDTFLGPPVQHLWLSPGGTVELVEVSTRKTTVERTVEQSTESTTKSEKSLTNQDDLSEAVKQDNEDNIKLGASAKANERWGWGDATETASIDYSSTEKTAREQTHKTMRQQSTKLTTEIKTNFKTTFRTVTETTDMTSRRYVLSNTTETLVNYELRRKMRQVGVQVQDLGAQLCWQTYVDDPGAELGIAKLVHIAAPPDFSSLGPINELPVPEDYTVEMTGSFSLKKANEDDDDDSDDGSDIRGWPVCYVPLHPKDGFEYFDHGTVKWTSPGSFSTDITLNAASPDTVKVLGDPPQGPFLFVYATYGWGHNGEQFSFTVPVTFTPSASKISDIHTQNGTLLKDRNDERDRLSRQAFMTAAADRIKVASNIQPRSFDVLRDEERIVVYRRLVRDLCEVGVDLTVDRRVLHKASELISTMFDVDAMLYFVAPEWWRPHTHTHAEEPSGDLMTSTAASGASSLPGATRPVKQHVEILRKVSGIDNSSVVRASDLAAAGRDNYEITSDSAPAPLGASLGWLLQLDGDNQRNAFLNAPWVKAVIPIRPGKELDAINWIGHTSIEGADGLDDPYQASSDNEEAQIVAGLQEHEWPPGPRHDRYATFAQQIAANPATTYVSIRDALTYLALRIQVVHQAGEQLVSEDLGDGVKLNYLRPDMVYEHGFDPLKEGFRANTAEGQEYQPFTQWVEVLPTEQIVAVQVTYDPTTGRQIPLP
jgi:hypothetical protein